MIHHSSPSNIPLSQLQLNSVPSAFHPFRLLPKEIRLEIWQLSHPRPQNVILTLPPDDRALAGAPGLDKQWILHKLPRSQFAALYVNHEARDLFLAHYQVIFAGFPNNEEMRKEGKKGGWYFNAREDSLCFGDGVRGLKWFMSQFPEDDIWSQVRYIDVDVNLRAFHGEGEYEGYMAAEEKSVVCLAKMNELKLVSLRVIANRPGQLNSRHPLRWMPWKNNEKILKDWLEGAVTLGSGVSMAMQYIWTDAADGSSILEGHEAFIKSHHGTFPEDIRRRWVEMGVFLPNGRNKPRAPFMTRREIFCQNLEIRLHEAEREGQGAINNI